MWLVLKFGSQEYLGRVLLLSLITFGVDTLLNLAKPQLSKNRNHNSNLVLGLQQRLKGMTQERHLAEGWATC